MGKLQIADGLWAWINHFLLCIMLSLTSCVTGDGIKQRNLVEVSSIQLFPDSSFFSDLRHLQCHGDDLFMLDVNRRNVIKLNKSLESMTVYGIGGRGPGELQMPFSFTVHCDTVSILDFALPALDHYTPEGFAGITKLDFSPRDGRMSEKCGMYFIPLISEKDIYATLSVEGHVFSGEAAKIGSHKKTVTMNANDVLCYGDMVVVVPRAFPYVQLFSDGHLVKTIDFSEVGFYGNNMSYVLNRSQNNDENSFYVLNIDSYVAGDNLYVLCPRYGNSYRSDRIIVVSLQSGKVTDVFCLPDSNYNSICTDGELVFAFNSTRCSLDVLTIENGRQVWEY